MVERMTLNHVVVGSIPTGGVIYLFLLKRGNYTDLISLCSLVGRALA